MQLAIDTSTDTAALALVRDGRLLAEMTWRSGQNHASQLMPSLEHMLRQLGLAPSAITAVIVGRGPGSFNGLRVGVGAAKGLSFSLGVPIVGVSSLEATAYQYAVTGLPVCPVLNAGRGDIATAAYQMRPDGWRRLREERLDTVDGLCAGIGSPTLFCGDHVPAIGERLRELLGDRALIASPLTDVCRAAFLAELGLKRLEADNTDDAATLRPVYLRGPSITRAKHR